MEDTGLWGFDFTLAFPDGSTNQTRCVIIPIRNDTLLEGDHAFTVDITSAGSSPHAAVGTPSTATVNIEDDESELIIIILTVSLRFCSNPCVLKLLAKYIPLLSPVGTLMFDTVNSDALVTEGDMASVCVSISSSTTSLGCDLTVTLTTADGKATSKMLVFMLIYCQFVYCF